ncbi:hypothetical protein [Comamonas sp. NoAH]|uniref:hypothetical protein n=1 Tax=Comamonas halotolerans TaxID=3041496 RepID=UPI0024E0575C|nr:hypothetical protein [Comamonas sp. NoAH]
MGSFLISAPLFFALMSLPRNRFNFALKALGIHVALLSAILLSIVWVTLCYWIPAPYQRLVQTPQLFIIFFLVNIACGPLLTVILANPKKAKKELWLDFSLVALIQLGMLTYGMYTIANARPIALVFEVDRFVLVMASQIEKKKLPLAPQEYQTLPWKGPNLLGTRIPLDADEKLRSIELSIRGIEPSTRPAWWQDYELSRPQVIKRMHNLQSLFQRVSAQDRQLIETELQKTQRTLQTTFYLPLVSSLQVDTWIVLLDTQANIVGNVAVEGFQ